MEFWNSLLTEKSQNLLYKLKDKINFVLIGGWAVWLYTKMLKSKDIDIVLKDFSSLDFLKMNYNLSKNDKLKKYEVKIEEVDIDVYIPYFSKFLLPLEDLKKYTTKVENFIVPIPEVLLILKQQAEIARGDTVKGMKDKIDIISLCNKADFKKYNGILEKYKLEHLRARLKGIIKNFNEPKYFNLNFVELKKLKTKLLKNVK